MGIFCILNPKLFFQIEDIVLYVISYKLFGQGTRCEAGETWRIVRVRVIPALLTEVR